jgi:hypothetical protein
MKINSILLALTAVLAGMSLRAASVPPSTAPEAALTASEHRAALRRQELIALDTRIEGRIDLIIETLRAIGDSDDSGKRVARMKDRTIAALNNTIAYYQTKRGALQEEMNQSSLHLTDEQKRNGVDTFDARIAKRMAQIIAVQKSMPGRTDFEHYRVALRDSIARMEQQSRALKAANGTDDEIAKNKALLAVRRKQLAAALAPAGPATQNVGESHAQELEKALQTEIAGLRKDFTTLFARYSAYLQELSALNQSRAALKPQT